MLAAAENARFVDLVQSLGAGDWGQPTDCSAWDVRALCTHVLGMMEANVSSPRSCTSCGRGGRRRGTGPTSMA